MEMQIIMEEQFNHFTPDCPTKVETAIMRRWSKKAVPTFDSNMRLIPWEPPDLSFKIQYQVEG